MYGLFNRSRLTMHLDKSYIGLLPIIESPDKAELDELVGIVEDLEKNSNSEEGKKYLRSLDKVVYKLYGLNEEEINIIENSVSEMLSKKSVW